MKILLIDNHDSFVYNITGSLKTIRAGGYQDLRWDVVRNDVIPDGPLQDYDAVILSPGPGLPEEANGLMALMRRIAGTHPVLGICLGCQALAVHFGARLRRLDNPRHGHMSRLKDVDPSDPVVGCVSENGGEVGRYHSWVVDEETVPSCLIVTSRDEDGDIMSLRHESLPLYGVQFHPESMITRNGDAMIRGFLEVCSVRERLKFRERLK